jgi:hypothetical protein
MRVRSLFLLLAQPELERLYHVGTELRCRQDGAARRGGGLLQVAGPNSDIGLQGINARAQLGHIELTSQRRVSYLLGPVKPVTWRVLYNILFVTKL